MPGSYSPFKDRRLTLLGRKRPPLSPGSTGSNSPPGAFTAGQWTAAATGVSGVIRVVISALPSGTPFTDIEYSTNGGASYTSSGRTTTGSFDIAGLTDGVSYDIKIRAVNAAGNGPDSDTKTRTPTASYIGAFYPVLIAA